MKKLILILLFIPLINCSDDSSDDNQNNNSNLISSLYGTYFLQSYSDSTGDSYYPLEWEGTIVEGECSQDMLIFSEESCKYQYDIVRSNNGNYYCNWDESEEIDFYYSIENTSGLVSGQIEQAIGYNTEGIRFDYGGEWEYEDYLNNYFELQGDELLYVEQFQNSSGTIFTCTMVWVKQ